MTPWHSVFNSVEHDETPKAKGDCALGTRSFQDAIAPKHFAGIAQKMDAKVRWFTMRTLADTAAIAGGGQTSAPSN
jgi:hypothetical protein